MRNIKEKIYPATDYNNIRDILNNAVKLHPNNNAFIIKQKINKNEFNYKHITYTEFQKDINSLGTSLLNIGLKDKRIAIISKNNYEWAVSYFAVLNGVGVAVPLDKGLPENEVILSLKRISANVIIFSNDYSDIMKKLKQDKSTQITNYICMDSNENKEFLYLYDLINERI